MGRWTDWWNDPYAPREGDEPVLVAKSSEAERGRVSSVEAAEEGIARLVAKTDSRIVHPAFYVTRDQRLADLKNDITNWPWTEREDDDDKDSDAASSLPVRETV